MLNEMKSASGGKKTKIYYWIFTSLFGAFMLFTSIPDIIGNEDAIKFMNGLLQYPVYIIPFISWAKVLGVVALLIPGFPKIKEWAYAGFAFDLLGATYSVIVVGGFMIEQTFMLLPIGLGVASYIFHHKKLNYENAKQN